MGSDEQEIIDPIFENMYGLYLKFGSVRGGANYDGSDVKWARTGGLVFNTVFGARFAPDEAEDRVAQITEVVKSWNVRVQWHLDPDSTPNLATHLERYGWEIPEPPMTCKGMAANLKSEIPEVPIPQGLKINRVADEESLREWAGIYLSQAPEQVKESWITTVCELGCEDHSPWQYFTGFMHGEPVASTMLFFGAGVAGLYLIGTLPQARQQGIGTAITRYAMQQAKDMGYKLAILHATAMGEPIYRSLGFREYCTKSILVLRP